MFVKQVWGFKFLDTEKLICFDCFWFFVLYLGMCSNLEKQRIKEYIIIIYIIILKPVLGPALCYKHI